MLVANGLLLLALLPREHGNLLLPVENLETVLEPVHLHRQPLDPIWYGVGVAQPMDEPSQSD